MFQDLQPYVCTYPDCLSSEQLFRSRREWIAHEQGHRKLWQCPLHIHAVYDSRTALERHFTSDHPDQISQSQLDPILSAAETSANDLREKCPICLASAVMHGGISNHIANHLERFALFGLPRDVVLSDEKDREDDHSGKSNAASEGWKDVSESSRSDKQSEGNNSDKLVQDVTINAADLAAYESAIDTTLRRVYYVIERSSEPEDPKALTNSLYAVKSGLQTIRAKHEIDSDSIDAIGHDLTLFIQCLRQSLRSFEKQFQELVIRREEGSIEARWRDLGLFFERHGFGLAEQAELYRTFIQSLHGVLEG